jgi:hypothetical protein
MSTISGMTPRARTRTVRSSPSGRWITSESTPSTDNTVIRGHSADESPRLRAAQRKKVPGQARDTAASRRPLTTAIAASFEIRPPSTALPKRIAEADSSIDATTCCISTGESGFSVEPLSSLRRNWTAEISFCPRPGSARSTASASSSSSSLTRMGANTRTARNRTRSAMPVASRRSRGMRSSRSHRSTGSVTAM